MELKKYVNFFENLEVNQWIEEKYKQSEVVREYVSLYFKDKKVNPILDIRSSLNTLSDVDIKILI